MSVHVYWCQELCWLQTKVCQCVYLYWCHHSVEHWPWCSSIVKYVGSGQAGQAIKLLQVPREITFTFLFWHTSLILHAVKLAVIQQQVLNEWVWHFRGWNILWPSYIFSREVRTPTPPWSTPMLLRWSGRRYACDVCQWVIWVCTCYWCHSVEQCRRPAGSSKN